MVGIFAMIRYQFISAMSDQRQESILTRNEVEGGEAEDRDAERDSRFDGLGRIHIWAYGVGHFVNDLVAGCWFNYLLYFLNKVVGTSAAPAAILSGQLCDGVATPIVGMLSDRTNTRFGQRKPWYIGGLVLVVVCFVPIFSGFKSESTGAEYSFYIIFPSIFNFGWAALQISHMSLVPSLTCSRKRRDKLNNLRNLFTFISNFTIFGFGLIVFSTMSDKLLEYKLIAYISLAIGTVASVFFIKVIDEPTLVRICHQKQEDLKALVEEQKYVDKKIMSATDFSLGSDDESQAIVPIKKRDSKLDWFKMPKFYLFGICYMSVRIYTNLFGTLLPFYLTDVVRMGSDNEDEISFNLALVPMLTYGASVVMSTQLDKFYQHFGRKKALFVGTVICIVCLAVMAFLTAEYNWVMYVLAFFVGASQSLVLATGINLISDVVGNKGKTGAFVFGIYSLLDKFSCGIIIFLVGITDPYTRRQAEITDDDRAFIRLTMILIPGISCLLSSLIVLSYPIQEYGRDKKKNKDSGVLINQKSQLEEELVS